MIAELRGQRVYARSDDDGELVAESGRVEIRYKPTDGRRYRAAARNLKIVEPIPLPDDTCAPADDPAEKKKTAKKTSKKKGGRAASADHTQVATDARVVAYTDGACSGNPGPAGLGVVFMVEKTLVERFEYLGEGTNNIAELTAILRAVEELGDQPGPAAIFTDSRYSIGVLQQGWKAKEESGADQTSA